MVAIITGQGLGVERGSGFVLGSRGQLGDASVGTGGDNVTINAATGNLNITRTDQLMFAYSGPREDLLRSYNSMGAATDDNQDDWSVGNGKTITHVTGTVNTAGSTVTRMDWDGSDTLYTYDTSLSLYVSKQGTGAYDTLSYSSTASTWTWRDGTTQLTELYTVAVNPNDAADTYWATLTSSNDTDNQGIRYFWSGNKLTGYVDAGVWMQFTYSGNNLTKVNQYLAGGTIVTSIYYGYDLQNRLASVTTDLSPADNSTTDNNVVTTSYTYTSTSSHDVASITQWAGWSGTGTKTGLLEIFYDGSNRVSSYRQTISTGVTATTTLTYVSSTQTTVTDANGNVTTLTYDANKQLTRIDYPAITGGAPSMSFAYDANGNVTSATDAYSQATTYGYDTSGNMVWQRSPTGDETTWTYDSGNRVLTKTDYTGRDPDAGGTGSSPTGPMTTRYVYDAYDNLNYVISGTGEVTEYDWYQPYEVMSSQITYRDNVYNLTGLSPSTAITQSQAATWVAGIADKSNAQRTNFWYDAHGLLAMSYAYSACNADGTGNAGKPLSVTTYTHDQYGNLLTKQMNSKNVETFIYDGLNRLVSSTDMAGLITTYVFNDAAGTETVTTPQGMVTTSTFNMVGELVSTQVAGTATGTGIGIVTGTTSYAYDTLGNLTMVTDANNNKSYHLYDADGNKIADVAADGSATQYRYTENGQLWVTIRYSNKLNAAGLAALAATSGIGATFASLAPYFTVDAANDTYSWRTYDSDGLLSATLDGAGDMTSYTYDGAGNLLSSDTYRIQISQTNVNIWRGAPALTVGAGSVDAGRDLLERNWYDADGRVIGTLDGANHLTTYTYDTAGEVVQKTSYANTATWNADLPTTILSITLDAAHDQTTRYFYDGRGLMVYSLDNNLVPTEYDYEWYTDNLIGTIKYGAAIASTTTYTAAYIAAQISSLALKTNANTVGGWTIYDAADRVIETIDGAGDATIDTYDALSNLATITEYANALSAGAINSYKTSAPGTLQTPTADATHDRVTQNFYDSAGRLAGMLDADHHLTMISYDAAGNKVREITYANAPATTTGTLATVQGSVTANAALDRDVRYFYDADERLQYALTNLTVTEYQYNGQGELNRTIQYDGQITAPTLPTVYTNAYVAGQIISHGLASVPTTRITDQVYDLGGRLSYTIDGSGAVTYYALDGRGLVAWEVQYAAAFTLGALPTKLSDLTTWLSAHNSDSANRVTFYYRDAAGNLAVQLDPEGRLTQYSYDYAGRLTLETRYTGTYSATGSTDLTTLIPTTLPSGSEQLKYSYDALGRLTDSYDGLNVDTHTVYDAQDRVVSVAVAFGSPDVATTSFTYDAAGRVLTSTDPMGNVTTCTYDAQGNCKTETDGNGFVTTNTYDALGNLLTRAVPVTATTSAITTYQYNAFGQAIVTTDALSHVSYSFYNAIGKLSASLDAEGYYTTYTYDSFGDLTQTYHYANKVTATIVPGVMPTAPTVNATEDEKTLYTYDGVGRMLSTTDAEGHTESYTYSEFGQVLTDTTKLVVPTAPTVGVITNTYDRRGLLLTQTKTGEVAYTAAGTAESGPVKTVYTYDDFGNALTMVEASGLTEARTTSYTYDHDNRLVTTTAPAVLVDSQSTFAQIGTTAISAVTTYKYDYRGNVVEQDDALGNRTLTFYDASDRKIASLNALGYLSTWSYDHVGNVMGERVYGTAITLPTLPGGTPPAGTGSYRETTYGYDRANELLTTTVAGVQTWQVGQSLPTTGSVVLTNTYDLNGNVIMQTDGNGQHVWFFYDKRGDKIAQVDQDSYLTTYALDWDGNVLTETRYATAVTTPTTTPLPSAPPAPPTGTSNANDRITNFTYDRMGRRLTEQRMNVSISSLDSSFNLLTAVTGNSTVTYTYNAIGEVLTKQEATGDITTYTYDAFGRQLTVVGAGFTDVTGATVHDTTAMSYDGLNQLVRSVENGSRVTTDAYNAAGEKTSQTDATGFTTQYFYDLGGRMLLTQYNRMHSDGITVTTEAQRLTYDALGRVIKQDTATLSGTTWTAGDSTNLQYDAWNEVTAKGANGLYQETDSYDNAGRVIRSTDSDGTVKFYLYDPNGHQTAIITSDGTTLAGGYSWATVTEPQLLSLLTAGTGGALGTSALGSVNVAGIVLTFTTYDARGMATLTTLPFRQLSSTSTATLLRAQTYDAFGEIVTQTDTYDSTDPTPPTTTYTYDTLGKITSTALPAMTYYSPAGASFSAAPTTFTYYDASGRVIATKDADGNVNTRKLLAGSGYDGTDALEIVEKHPDSGVFETWYDVNRDAVKRNINGIIGVGSGEVDETSVYDGMNRLVEIDHVTIAAGALGNTSVYSQQLVDVYIYDGLGQRITHKAEQKLNGLLEGANWDTTDYDLEGRVTQTVSGAGTTMNYAYSWIATVATALGTTGGWQKSITGTPGFGAATAISTEVDDYFGNKVTFSDPSSAFTDAYNMAGRVVTETGGSWGLTNQLTTTTYYNTGAIKGVTSGDNDGTASDTDYEVASYTYDAAGNRLTETLSHTYSYLVSGTTYAQITLSLENEVATWDDDHHMLTVKDLSGAQWTATSTGVRTAQTGDPFSITYWYDLDGNIRRMQSTYDTLTATGTDTTAGGEDYWYTYDAMNRFVITRGALSGTVGTGTIVAGSTGTSMTYNRDGTRATVTNGVDGTVETDTYTAAGLLGQVQVGSFVRGTYAYDAYGRAWDYTEYDATVAHNVIYDRTSYYNDGGVVTQDAVKTVRGSTTTLVSSDYTYNLYGQVSTVETATQTNGGTPVDSETRYYYFTFNGASETASVYYSPNLAGPPVTYVTGYAYDGLGRLKEIDVSDGHPRTLLYQSDLTGQIIRRDQVGTAPHEVHYYFNGIQVGDVSNNGAGSDLDYAQELADRVATQGSGQFHNGTNVAVAYANFDQSYDPLNGYDANASSSYTVVGGDTLQSIAQVVWGDSSLWYLIANANGLSGDDTLTAGMSLIIPNNVINVHNNATTFKPYDPNSAIGYVDPTVPKKASSCGVMGQIILAVIAVVVTVVTWGGASEIAAGLLGVDATSSTAMVLAADALGGAMAGAAGSLASQAFGLATGLQKSFNWGGLAMAAIGGAVGGGIGGTGWAADLTESLGSFASGAITGAVGSVVTQGIGVATGLQKKFDWAGVAAAGIGGGVSSQVDDWVGYQPGVNTTENDLLGGIGGMAGMIANAATRTLVNGSDFGDNIVAALPDTIAQTVGSIVARQIGGEDAFTWNDSAPAPCSNGPSPAVSGSSDEHYSFHPTHYDEDGGDEGSSSHWNNFYADQATTDTNKNFNDLMQAAATGNVEVNPVETVTVYGYNYASVVGVTQGVTAAKIQANFSHHPDLSAYSYDPDDWSHTSARAYNPDYSIFGREGLFGHEGPLKEYYYRADQALDRRQMGVDNFNNGNYLTGAWQMVSSFPQYLLSPAPATLALMSAASRHPGQEPWNIDRSDADTTMGIGSLALAGMGDLPIGAPGETPPLSVPQGITQAQFDQASQILQARAAQLGLGDDIFVHGSRAVGLAAEDSDIDFGIRVSEDDFDTFLNGQSKLASPNPGSSLADTRDYAVENGIIQRGEARLSGTGRQLEDLLGMKVDLSVIRAGGNFDKGPFIPVPKN